MTHTEIQDKVGRLSKQAADEVKKKADSKGDLSAADQEVVKTIVTDLLAQNKDFVAATRRSETTPLQTNLNGDFFKSKAWRESGGSVQKMMELPTPTVGGHKEATILALKEQSDDVYLMGAMKSIAEGVPYDQAVCSLKAFTELQEELNDFTKALGTDITAGGAEFIPTNFSSELIDEVRLNLQVAALHRTIRMPSNPYTLPVKVGRSTAYIASQASSNSPSSLTRSQLETSNVSLDAKVLAVATPFSFEFTEDSVIPVMPMVRRDVALGIADAVENSIINGDLSAADSTGHFDTGLGSLDSDHQLCAWEGYRGLTNAAEKQNFNTGTEDFSTSNFRNIRKLMKRYGVRPTDLAWVMSIEAYIRMLSLSEVNTLDKLGPRATVITGELARFDNIPVIVSEHCRADLNTSGIYDNSTTTTTAVLCVHRPSFVLGERRAINIENVRQPLTQQNIVVSTYRVDFKKVYPTVDQCVGWGYNITS